MNTLRLPRLFVCFAFALASPLACTARGGSGSFGPETDGATASQDGTRAALSFTCPQICDRLATAPSCGPGSVGPCVASCEQYLSRLTPGCVAAAEQVFVCTQTSSLDCAAPGGFAFTSCGAQLQSYTRCVASRPVEDGGVMERDVAPPPRDVREPGDPCVAFRSCSSCTAQSQCGWCANRCWVGTSSGPTGASCGGERWAWTSSMCSSGGGTDGGAVTMACQQCAVTSCSPQIQACIMDSTCGRCLSTPSAPGCSSNPAARAVLTCICETCSSECAPVCTMP